ncbi:PaaI family thioesterase [Aspergillus glaucus CBS 516.65]|uniref:Thioesterase domain-containing protein n=1 Tax=Aspergillus glaucus CBS 516.65 TaxID=1160497 RepID=A0A1L9VI09_ASPGL|nr:hypothetical protein ASPGLDRAFT_26457 [Aspergillus glaucus CBS 516.65]OJJ83568.1 hypothetical protein ASPGLDRAFT_26457 [Aspergillus glaucus CBS 516.65]
MRYFPSSVALRESPTTATRLTARPRLPLPRSVYLRGSRSRYSTETVPVPPHPQQPQQPQQPRSRLRRFVGFTSIAFFAFTAGLFYQTIQTTSRIMAAPMPSDEETLTSFVAPDALSQEIEDFIHNHPLSVSLRENPEFTESRPHLKIPEYMRARNLTAGTLAGPNKIVVPPVIFSEKDGKSMTSLLYLGSDLSGHPGIVHGGLLATLLDEGLARCCFPALPNKVGVTANLNIDYRLPAMANSYVIMKAETVKVEGRKAWVEGRLETLPKDGQEPAVLVEAKALFIEPRQAVVCSP